MRLSTVILPVHRWREGQKLWRRAEELGFHAAYTYDHLSWHPFRDETWFGAVPTLTAAATATERIRLGPLVTSPNFRHPGTLAQELTTLDDISGGRLTVGVGAGGPGFDTQVLGDGDRTPRQQADRFAEFVPLLDGLLRRGVTTRAGRPERPRVPLCVAATGPRGLRTAARYGQGWVTCGDPADPDVPAERAPGVVAAQAAALTAACEAEGRDPGSLDRLLVQGFTRERPLASLGAFVQWAGTYRELGITELVVHWPVPNSPFAADPTVFERIATEALAQLA